MILARYSLDIRVIRGQVSGETRVGVLRRARPRKRRNVSTHAHVAAHPSHRQCASRRHGHRHGSAPAPARRLRLLPCCCGQRHGHQSRSEGAFLQCGLSIWGFDLRDASGVCWKESGSSGEEDECIGRLRDCWILSGFWN